MPTDIMFAGNLCKCYTEEELRQQWNEKPHLVLDWVFDNNTKKLTCVISDTLMYEGLSGGKDGLNRYIRNSTDEEWQLDKHITAIEWHETEKFAISAQYGEKYGYYQPDHSRVKVRIDRNGNEVIEGLSMGFGPDLRYIDHFQRLQAVMEGEDCTIITLPHSLEPPVIFETPDNGKTIVKREITKQELFYQDPTPIFEHPQPCAMQPYTLGREASSIEEMRARGVSEFIIQQCIEGKIASPLRPDVQKYFIYPKETK